MRRFIILAIVVLAGLAIWWLVKNRSDEKHEKASTTMPIAHSRHSDDFNESIEDIMDAYYELTDDFVNWDSADINNKAAALSAQLDSLRMDELKKNDGLYETARTFVDNAKNDLKVLQQAAGLTAKRRSLHSLSENLFNFLRVVQYDKEKIYLQECPMAFNDVEPGMWLSKEAKIVNPYLGTKHPRYGKGMLHCGETKETLNYTEEK